MKYIKKCRQKNSNYFAQSDLNVLTENIKINLSKTKPIETTPWDVRMRMHVSPSTAMLLMIWFDNEL